MQCISNRCKNLIKRKKCFGVRCTLTSIKSNELMNVFLIFQICSSGWGQENTFNPSKIRSFVRRCNVVGNYLLNMLVEKSTNIIKLNGKTIWMKFKSPHSKDCSCWLYTTEVKILPYRLTKLCKQDVYYMASKNDLINWI